MTDTLNPPKRGRPPIYVTVHDRRTAYTRIQRMRLIDFLGGKCAKCGEKDFCCLQVDHKNPCGSRRETNTSTLRNAVFANPENYQLLCANCNWRKRCANKEVRFTAKPSVRQDTIGTAEVDFTCDADCQEYISGPVRDWESLNEGIYKLVPPLEEGSEPVPTRRPTFAPPSKPTTPPPKPKSNFFVYDEDFDDSV